MSRRPGIIGQIWLNFKNSFSAPKLKGRLVGQDEFGNRFYENEGDRKKNLRSSRWVEAEGGDQFTVPEIHPQWDTWLRGRRKDPPTEEEIARNLAMTSRTLQRAKELEEKQQMETIPDTSQDKTKRETYHSDIAPDIDKGSFPTYAEYENVPGEFQRQEIKKK